ncbi:MAG TPA: calcium-translocating P-type ATPase, PMCA-type [Candidatus Nanoarchaeia archaeon]
MGTANREGKPIYSLTNSELFSLFGTAEAGLSEQEARKRLETYGPNKLSEKKKVSPLKIYFSQFKNILVLILILAAVFIYLVYFFGEKNQSDFIEGNLIVGIILMITTLGFIQEYKAEEAIAALKKLLAFKARVIRGGEEKEVDISLLVPGDLVVLEEGVKIPADTRLIEAIDLHSNESSLTGESIPVKKNPEPLSGPLQTADQVNMVFSSTEITKGRGRGIVVRTGDEMEIGKIAKFVAETKKEETPIQKRLNRLGKIVGLGVVGISAFIFLFIVFISSEYMELTTLERVLHSFVAAVALAVAAIPEGLPAVVTISLAYGTQRMLKRNTLVRKLASTETLGSVDTICTDKTGTLTTGEMAVRKVYFDGKTYEIVSKSRRLTGDFLLAGEKADPRTLTPILKAGLICNNAAARETGRAFGDPTEVALIFSARQGSVKSAGKRLFEVPFSSERKMMSVVIEEEGKRVVYSKGAPEVILSKCTKLVQNGQVVPLRDVAKKKILVENADLSSAALRVLGFAYKETEKVGEETLETDLAFIGLQAMMDPPRKEVRGLIEDCQKSGIRVIMITGDHSATAKAVACEIGISGEILTGAELDKLSRGGLEKKVGKTNIYARVNPEHKFRIVEALQKRGHLVAMTGDGVNDAPALKRSDIGIAMGITGTDVAKEASDMILLDDKFGTIVAAVEEGRGIFDNIRRFVDYLLSCNIGEVLVIFIALLIFKDLPLTAVMILWINVVTDGLPAIALGLDPAEKGILHYSPRKFQGQIISQRIWLEMGAFSISLTVATLGLFYLNLQEGGLFEARAAAFMAIIIFELVRLVNIRSDYQISWAANLWLPAAIVTSVLLQIAIVHIPTLSTLFEVSPIDLFDWLYITIVGLLLFFVLKFVDKLLDLFPTFSPVVAKQRP